MWVWDRFLVANSMVKLLLPLLILLILEMVPVHQILLEFLTLAFLVVSCTVDLNLDPARSPSPRRAANSTLSENVLNVTDNRNKDKNCRLKISEYQMAVYGHLSGDANGDYYGAKIEHTGVVTEAGTLTSSLTPGQICS